MRVAVVSDIHANLHALEAVLAAIDAEPAGRALVPRRPRRLRAAAERVLRARRGASGRLPRREPRPRRASERSTSIEFSGDAGAAAAWTRGVLDRRVARLSRPPRAGTARRTASRSSTAARATRCGSTSSPTRRPLATLRTDRGAARARRPQPRGAPGSSSRRRDSTAASRRPAPSSTSRRHAGCSIPGSVGQPRDGDPRAAYLVLDLDAQPRELPPGRVRHRADAGEIARRRTAASCSPTRLSLGQ